MILEDFLEDWAKSEKTDIANKLCIQLKTYRAMTDKDIAPLVSSILQVGNRLIGFEKIALLTLVNMNTLNIKLEEGVMTNNSILVMPQGTGKSTYLYYLLKKNNPNLFPDIPDRPFESQLIKMPQEAFNRKIWVLDDLMTSFKGVSFKQKEQLQGFHIKFLSERSYSRANVKVQGKIVCQYGWATEAYVHDTQPFSKFQKESIFLPTFKERFVTIRPQISQDETEAIVSLKSYIEKNEIFLKSPKIKFPFCRREQEVSVGPEFYDEAKKLSLEFRNRGVKSQERARQYILNWLKSCANFNKRRAVKEIDMKLFYLVNELHFGLPTSLREIVRDFIIVQKNRLSGREIKNNFPDWSDSRIAQILKELKDEGIIKFEKISGGEDSYDFEYWM